MEQRVQVGPVADRVGAFEQEDGASSVGRRRRDQVAGTEDRRQRALVHPAVVPPELGDGGGVGLVGVAVAALSIDRRGAEDRRADEPDAAPAKVGQADGGNALLVGNLLDRRAHHVPPAQRVVSQVEMGVDDEQLARRRSVGG